MCKAQEVNYLTDGLRIVSLTNCGHWILGAVGRVEAQTWSVEQAPFETRREHGRKMDVTAP